MYFFLMVFYKVEDAVSRAADGTAVQELDFSSLRSQLGPLATVSFAFNIFFSLHCNNYVINAVSFLGFCCWLIILSNSCNPCRFFCALM